MNEPEQQETPTAWPGSAAEYESFMNALRARGLVQQETSTAYESFESIARRGAEARRRAARERARAKRDLVQQVIGWMFMGAIVAFCAFAGSFFGWRGAGAGAAFGVIVTALLAAWAMN